MFRSTKKKQRKTLRTSGSRACEDLADDVDDSVVIVHRKKKFRPRSGIAIRSFDDEAVDAPPESKRKKKKGLGFGGGHVGLASRAVADAGTCETNDKDRVLETERPSYDRNALEKLKSEQSKRKPQKETDQSLRDSSQTSSGDPHVDSAAQVQHFSLRSEPNSRASEMENDSKRSGPDAENIEESVDWEQQVARRAGVRYAATPPAASNLPDLDGLRAQLQSTADHLATQQNDIANAVMRREADLARLQSDLTQHQATVEEVGLACDYYQRLRQDLALWVGALRDLQRKVDPIYESVTELILQQHQMNQKEWGDIQEDATTVLKEASVLSTIVGRQPDLPAPKETETSSAVDEFGRDLRSQFSREREKRFRSRATRRVFDSHVNTDEDTNSILRATWMKEADIHSRYKMLMEALHVAFDDLDNKYTDLSRLVEVVCDWNKSYPEDVLQCYANLSLGDLSSVLLKADLCRSALIDSMLRMHEDGSDRTLTFSWISQLEKIDCGNGSDEGAVERVLSRVHVPLLLSLFKTAPTSCFLYTRKSQLLSTYVSCLREGCGPNSSLLDKLLDALEAGIAYTLEHICIPIVDGTCGELSDPSLQVVQSANFARRIQGPWIQLLLLNLLRDWVPHYRGRRRYMKIGELILEFLSSKYLLLLSSLDKGEASALLSPIWNGVQSVHAEWLSSPSLMLQGAPLRAASVAYGL